ncbi:hypothetical protein C1X14_12920 [Pseudomonas sp. FW305-3-2-15-C-TSA3]|nr:hypothetical protein C1X22_16055 [Pseudomonas sp. DP16D-L5]PMV56063.1 hypothetical protein C1X19_15135 [Pseudomonas sp. GW460-4]PMV79968.1 hypothetical protein C1X14_12920 [Pseudomonas sp. FW305-3-2-15-C-TSA3]SFI11729.1 hypothetical protein SAMN03159342_01969 [Pseudomonas sp. NFPP04]SFI59728.1 hypothetical protein SAMN03159344_01269 [Pseudomonas sp. NFPP11]
MIEYPTLQSRVLEAEAAALVWNQGSRYIQDEPQSNKLESSQFYLSDTSLIDWLKTCRKLSEFS